MSIWRWTALLLMMAGCASSDHAERKRDNLAREAAFQFNGGRELQERASYDLRCPPQSMSAQVLQRAGMFAMAVLAGVRGCGLQATYVRMPGAGWVWVLNGPVTQDPTQQQYAAPPPGSPPPGSPPPGSPPPPPGSPPPPPSAPPPQ